MWWGLDPGDMGITGPGVGVAPRGPEGDGFECGGSSSSAERLPASKTSGGSDARIESSAPPVMSPSEISLAQLVGSTNWSARKGAAPAASGGGFLEPVCRCCASRASSVSEVNSRSASSISLSMIEPCGARCFALSFIAPTTSVAMSYVLTGWPLVKRNFDSSIPRSRAVW